MYTLIHSRLPVLAALCLTATGLVATSEQTYASDRHFSFLYEAVTMPKGALEFENWATWKAGKDDDGRAANTFEFRHELEYGITDHLQLGVYLANWEVVDEADTNEASFQGGSLELIYNLSNPSTDILGSAVYGEVKVGPEFVELEGKLILQKNFGPLIVAYNLTLESEWEGDNLGELDEVEGEFQQTFGVSYEVTPRFSVGAELLHEFEIEEWEEAGSSLFYIGPNASVRWDGGYVTVAPLVQCTGIKGEPDVQTRLIFGIHL